MINWIIQNIGTIVATAIILAIVVSVVVGMLKNKKKGKSPCGCSCGHCAMAGSCHTQNLTPTDTADGRHHMKGL